MNSDSPKCRLIVTLLAYLVITAVLACRSGLSDMRQDANQRAVAEWNRNMAILERGLSGGPLRGVEFESACLFFEHLTSIPIRGNGTPVGYLPTAETREDVESLKQWFANNREVLFWNERSKQVEFKLDAKLR